MLPHLIPWRAGVHNISLIAADAAGLDVIRCLAPHSSDELDALATIQV
ncbi:hypothetical protein Xmir_04411 [Xenorhabdus miraniensis]|uniref:Uncharacterized protein n=1 Tax=Xenorhabdus miraniensis TaxID=351674 RepID=A0A2D0J771_9GAMM|nr:hypothetical protein Xmir_04411 [Xenorhabdus miraniensis]